MQLTKAYKACIADIACDNSTTDLLSINSPLLNNVVMVFYDSNTVHWFVLCAARTTQWVSREVSVFIGYWVLRHEIGLHSENLFESTSP